MTRFDKLFEAKRSLPKVESEPVANEPPLPEPPKAIANERSLSLAKSKDPDYVRTTVYLPKNIHKKLKAAAADEEREMSDIVESVIQAWLEAKENA